MTILLVVGPMCGLSDGPPSSSVKGKQVKSYFKRKQNDISTQRPLEFIHLDHFGPTRTESISGKMYGLVILDDYTTWTWVKF